MGRAADKWEAGCDWVRPKPEWWVYNNGMWRDLGEVREGPAAVDNEDLEWEEVEYGWSEYFEEPVGFFVGKWYHWWDWVWQYDCGVDWVYLSLFFKDCLRLIDS